MKLCLALAAAAALLFPADISAGSKYGGIRDTVHLVAVDDGFGSGVMVEDYLMLTAAHVVKGAKVIRVGKEGATARVLRIDDETDIALLQVSLRCPCAPIAKSTPLVDTDVVVIGFPINPAVKAQIATEGQVQGVVDNRLMLNAPAAAGNSGGGVFVQRKDGAFELVGILVEMVGTCYGFSCGPVAHLSRAVETSLLRKFLQS